jgi:hypothetical protein
MPWLDSNGSLKLPKKKRTSESEVATPLTIFKGDVAPPHFKLMSVKNVGGLCLEHFLSSPFSFATRSISLLREPHFPVGPLPCLINTSADLSRTPDSSRYFNLVKELAYHKLIEPVPVTVPFEDTPLVILPLFAVVKEVEPPTARPIENGRLSKDSNWYSDFHLPGAKQLVDAFRTMNSANRLALHFDLANYYFQIPMPESNRNGHAFRCQNRLWRWRVLTMGYQKATLIAEGLTLDLCLRGLTLPEDVQNSPNPNGLVRLPSGGILVVIYDSVLLLDTRSNITTSKNRVERNLLQAHATLKYLSIAEHEVPFDFCGFEIRTGVDGIQWRISSSSLEPWLRRTRQSLPCTVRTVWQLAGFLTFAYTILQRPPRALTFIRRFQARRGLIEDEHWDVEDESLRDIVTNAVMRIQLLDAQNVWQRRVPIKRARCEEVLLGLLMRHPFGGPTRSSDTTKHGVSVPSIALSCSPTQATLNGSISTRQKRMLDLASS